MLYEVITNAAGPRRIRELTVPLAWGADQLRVGMSTQRLDTEVAWITRRLLLMTFAIGLLGMMAAWWLTRLIARPIEELVALARGVNAGQYQTKARVCAHDEVGELAGCAQ